MLDFIDAASDANFFAFTTLALSAFMIVTSRMEKEMKPAFKVKVQIGFFEHICKNPNCDCRLDPFIVAFKNKWLVELNMVTPNDVEPPEPVISGPYETKEEAEKAMVQINRDIKKDLRAQGFRFEDDANLRLLH